MINLNDSRFNIKQFVTEELLFEILSDYDIFNYYIDDLILNRAFESPLRNDKKPSFTVFWSNKYNRLLWKDHGSGDRGGSITFVMRLLGLGYKNTLEQIALDFKLDDRFLIGSNSKRYKTSNPIIHTREDVNNKVSDATIINITSRNFEYHDIKFWSEFGISEQTLRKYNVIPLRYIFINDRLFGADKYSYAYMEEKDGVVRYKIYQPFSINNKWINNLIEGTLSGWSQLDENGDLLIIASSLKDGMCLHGLGFTNFIAPQTENYIFKPHIVEDLKNRFDDIIVFYDHDKAGINAANRMNQLYGFKSITTMSEELKDPSDYYKYNKQQIWDILAAIRQ